MICILESVEDRLAGHSAAQHSKRIVCCILVCRSCVFCLNGGEPACRRILNWRVDAVVSGR
jgi:hypothetical protein